MSKTRLARVISIILGPPGWLPVLFLTIVFKSGLNNFQQAILLPTILILDVIIPLGYLFMAPKLGWAKAWDLPNRQERYPFFALLFFSNVTTFGLIYLLGATFLFQLCVMLTAILAVIILITFYWKISLHTSLATVGTIVLNFLFDWKLPYLYLTIPVVFWARLVLKRHNVAQLLAGCIVSGGLAILSLKVFNLI